MFSAGNLLEDTDKVAVDVSCTSTDVTVFIQLCAITNSGLNWRDFMMGVGCEGKLYDQHNAETDNEHLARKLGFKYGVGECGIQHDGFKFSTLVHGDFGFENRLLSLHTTQNTMFNYLD